MILRALVLVFVLMFITGCTLQGESQVEERKEVVILVKNSITNLPIKEVKMNFSVMCPADSGDVELGDPTCNGKYERIDAITNDKGVFVYKTSDKTPPIGDLLYFFVEKQGYYEDDTPQTTTDFDDGIVEIKMIPLKAPITKEKAIEIAENDSRTKKWLSKIKDITRMEGIYDGEWVIIFRWNVDNKDEIYNVNIRIDPVTGKIIDYSEYTFKNQS